MKLFKRKNILLILIVFSSLFVPFFLASRLVLDGNLNFWYDPARDFLLAVGNLEKITLIGPTTGIPGIFYGPYWIWLLSFGMLFTLDPKIVIFLVVTLPYFTLFPYILFKFRKIFGWSTCVILWTLFIFGPGLHYVLNPWNPHTSLLLFLLLVYLLTFLDLERKGKSIIIKILLIGFVAGLIINFHISFGLGVVLGVFLFLIVSVIRIKINPKQWIVFVAVYGAGIVISFMPFIIFELRHGFMQIQTALSVITSGDSVVAVKGLNDGQIVIEFFGKLEKIFLLPFSFAITIFGLAAGYFLYRFKKEKKSISSPEKKVLLLLVCVTSALMLLYLSSKNPVWSYHFIGTEIIFLLFLGVFMHKSLVLKIIFGCVALFVAYSTLSSFAASSKISPLTNSSLITKEYIVRIIHQDAKEKDYTVFAYSPSIYTYEYSYLLKWIANKDVPFDPGSNTNKPDLIYLIIPSSTPNKDDFINSKTPQKNFKTTKTWKIPDGTTIVKRIRK